MTVGTILITGASGFIGSAIAIDCLKAGYHLRVSLRKEEQIDKIRTLLLAYSKSFELVIVPDITQENAFAEKLHGIDYVLRLASPLPYAISEEACLDPAVKGTLSLLKEASNVPAIKKFLLEDRRRQSGLGLSRNGEAALLVGDTTSVLDLRTQPCSRECG